MKTYSIFETHAHYDDEAFEPDRDGLLSSLQGNGIGTVVNVCASVGELGRTITLTEKYPFVYGAVGVHPDDADKMTEQTLNEIRELSRREKILAIGEIGLDYYWHKEEAAHEIQKKMFRAQMDRAELFSLFFPPVDDTPEYCKADIWSASPPVSPHNLHNKPSHTSNLGCSELSQQPLLLPIF